MHYVKQYDLNNNVIRMGPFTLVTVDEGYQMPGGFDFELAEQPNMVGSTEIGYSRNSKFVDVKLVKKHLWDCMSDDIEDAKMAGKADGKKLVNTSFQDLVSRTVGRLPKGETENLSVAVCFICALHLCNEKTLKLEADGLTNFAVSTQG